MYELKNSSKNVKRNIKRYSIVGVLIFIISFISVIALIVNQSSESTIDYYLNQYGKTATIDIDPEQMSMNFSEDKGATNLEQGTEPVEIDEISYEDYVNYADSEYVDSVSYQQLTQVYNENLVTTDADAEEEAADTSSNQPEMVISQSGHGVGGFTLIGSDTLESSSYFEDDANVLVDGEMPTEDNQVLISSDLASYNDLAVGDKIKFGDENSENMVTLTISGLYQAASSEQMMMGVQNNIFTNYNTVSNFTTEHTNVSATYTLTSYQVVDEFEQELYDKGLDEMYYVNNNQTLLQQIIGPVESTMSILNNLLIVVFVIGGVILIFINLLILRERKYEIGVLRALGMKSRQVTRGLITEMVIVATIAMLFAIIIGVSFAQPISDTLISNSSISSDPMQVQTMGKGMSMTQPIGANTSSPVTSIDIQINATVLLVTLAINMVLILITTFVASRFINRQHPNEILREQ